MKQDDLDAIDADDYVVFGGGGIFGVKSDFSDRINAVLEKCRHVISWGCGHNHHYDRKAFENIRYNKFELLGVRDFGYPGTKNEFYLPCVSCMMSEMDEEYAIKRRIGIIEHISYPIREFPYDRISNACAKENVINFIGSSEIIITNSYHCVYWATLMKKKVILYQPFSDKFSYLENPAIVYSGNLEKDIDEALVYPKFKEKCRTANISFADRIYNQILNDYKNRKSDLWISEYDIRAGLEEKIGELKGKRVIVYGAGVHTEKLIPFLRNKDVEVIGVVADNEKIKSRYPFYKKNEMDYLDFDCVIVSSFKFRDSMKHEIYSKFPKANVWDLYDYFEKERALPADFYVNFDRENISVVI